MFWHCMIGSTVMTSVSHWFCPCDFSCMLCHKHVKSGTFWNRPMYWLEMDFRYIDWQVLKRRTLWRAKLMQRWNIWLVDFLRLAVACFVTLLCSEGLKAVLSQDDPKGHIIVPNIDSLSIPIILYPARQQPGIILCKRVGKIVLVWIIKNKPDLQATS